MEISKPGSRAMAGGSREASPRVNTQFEERLRIIQALLELEFSTIDAPTAEAELVRSQQRLTDLLDPDSDASQTKIAYHAENLKLEAIRPTISARVRCVSREAGTRQSRPLERDRATGAHHRSRTTSQAGRRGKRNPMKPQSGARRSVSPSRTYVHKQQRKGIAVLWAAGP